ncbi:nascent polypeptide-associated complex subunit alpha, muscle-specific form-like [Terrapene carolina triunguis]|uniref:nascent polypeptide-associated complex subunit alpha, muscle-specific form-like n=1 Tax=Terrapene triunguis TaxID=2587831 RepID=UPI00115666B9|nr:nascent polypeptide-associated complex subunit alpha, muscle-specific form-like [Terrapene carolina triunguis]
MRESPLEMGAGAAPVRRGGRALGRAPGSPSTYGSGAVPAAPASSERGCLPEWPLLAAAAQRTWLLPASLCVRARRTLSHDSGGGGGRRASKRGPSPRRAGRVRPQPPGAPRTAAGHSPRLGNPATALAKGEKAAGKVPRTAPPPSVPPAPRVLRTALVSHVPASTAPARPPPTRPRAPAAAPLGSARRPALRR